MKIVPALYRKKPVVISALRFDGTLASAQAIIAWAGGAISEVPNPSDGYRLLIKTLEGTVEARPGDYIIRGIAGEFYPCRSDIFLATYDAV